MNELLRGVYDCDFCQRLGFGFTRPAGRKGFYKFPPTIGAEGEAPILFIGINPRRSDSNRELHELIMRSEGVFRELARNKVNGARYIRRDGDEGHYNAHMRIVQSAFGDSANFEDHAAVTELFFCATEDSDGLFKMRSPCANTYLDGVLEAVKPQLIVCVGKTVMGYLRWKYGTAGEDSFEVMIHGRSVRVVRIVHPNDPEAGERETERLLGAATREAKTLAN